MENLLNIIPLLVMVFTTVFVIRKMFNDSDDVKDTFSLSSISNGIMKIIRFFKRFQWGD